MSSDHSMEVDLRFSSPPPHQRQSKVDRGVNIFHKDQSMGGTTTTTEAVDDDDDIEHELHSFMTPIFGSIQSMETEESISSQEDTPLGVECVAEAAGEEISSEEETTHHKNTFCMARRKVKPKPSKRGKYTPPLSSSYIFLLIDTIGWFLFQIHSLYMST